MRAAIAPHVAMRLNQLIPFEDIGNGTGLAEAAASVVAQKLAEGGIKAARDPQKALDAISDEQLIEVADAVRWLIDDREDGSRKVWNDSFTLSGRRQVGVHVEGRKLKKGSTNQTLVPRDTMPGLHEYPNRDSRRIGGPNEMRLRLAIMERLKNLPPMDVPHPTLAEIVVTSEEFWSQRIMMPLRCGPGITLQHEFGVGMIETMLTWDLGEAANKIFDICEQTWEHRAFIDESYARCAELIEPVMAKVRALGIHYRFIGVELNMNHLKFNSTPKVLPVFEILGNDLRPMQWRPWTSKGIDDVADAVEGQMAVQRKRKRELDKAAQNGARGMIAKVALAAIEASTSDTAEVLRLIGSRQKVKIDLGRKGRREDPLRLSWRNGIVHSSFSISDNISWGQGRLTVKNTQIPQTILQHLPGRSISTMLEHPLLNPGDTIRSVSGRGSYLRVNVDFESRAFDSIKGAILD